MKKGTMPPGSATMRAGALRWFRYIVGVTKRVITPGGVINA